MWYALEVRDLFNTAAGRKKPEKLRRTRASLLSGTATASCRRRNGPRQRRSSVRAGLHPQAGIPLLLANSACSASGRDLGDSTNHVRIPRFAVYSDWFGSRTRPLRRASCDPSFSRVRGCSYRWRAVVDRRCHALTCASSRDRSTSTSTSHLRRQNAFLRSRSGTADRA